MLNFFSNKLTQGIILTLAFVLVAVGSAGFGASVRENQISSEVAKFVHKTRADYAISFCVKANINQIQKQVEMATFRQLPPHVLKQLELQASMACLASFQETCSGGACD